MKRILFVCLGNICRSPLAEGILRKKLEAAGLQVQVDSAGTISWHAGDPPDSRSVATAKKYGIDISSLRGRHFTPKDFRDFDLILVMDRNNASDVLMLAGGPADVAKVRMLMDYIGKGSDAEVPDPYYGGLKDFDDLYHLLDEACDQLLAKISKSAAR